MEAFIKTTKCTCKHTQVAEKSLNFLSFLLEGGKKNPTYANPANLWLFNLYIIWYPTKSILKVVLTLTAQHLLSSTDYKTSQKYVFTQMYFLTLVDYLKPELETNTSWRRKNSLKFPMNVYFNNLDTFCCIVKFHCYILKI